MHFKTTKKKLQWSVWRDLRPMAERRDPVCLGPVVNGSRSEAGCMHLVDGFDECRTCLANVEAETTTILSRLCKTETDAIPVHIPRDKAKRVRITTTVLVVRCECDVSVLTVGLCESANRFAHVERLVGRWPVSAEHFGHPKDNVTEEVFVLSIRCNILLTKDDLDGSSNECFWVSHCIISNDWERSVGYIIKYTQLPCQFSLNISILAKLTI